MVQHQRELNEAQLRYVQQVQRQFIQEGGRIHGRTANQTIMVCEEPEYAYDPLSNRATARMNTRNIDIQKYHDEIVLQMQEYRERNNSSPSFLKVNKRALQILYYCEIYNNRHLVNFDGAVINEYMGLKVCPTDDIELEYVEVF